MARPDTIVCGMQLMCLGNTALHLAVMARLGAEHKPRCSCTSLGGAGYDGVDVQSQSLLGIVQRSIPKKARGSGIAPGRASSTRQLGPVYHTTGLIFSAYSSGPTNALVFVLPVRNTANSWSPLLSVRLITTGYRLYKAALHTCVGSDRAQPSAAGARLLGSQPHCQRLHHCEQAKKHYSVERSGAAGEVRLLDEAGLEDSEAEATGRVWRCVEGT